MRLSNFSAASFIYKYRRSPHQTKIHKNSNVEQIKCNFYPGYIFKSSPFFIFSPGSKPKTRITMSGEKSREVFSCVLSLEITTVYRIYVRKRPIHKENTVINYQRFSIILFCSNPAEKASFHLKGFCFGVRLTRLWEMNLLDQHFRDVGPIFSQLFTTTQIQIRLIIISFTLFLNCTLSATEVESTTTCNGLIRLQIGRISIQMVLPTCQFSKMEILTETSNIRLVDSSIKVWLDRRSRDRRKLKICQKMKTEKTQRKLEFRLLDRRVCVRKNDVRGTNTLAGRIFTSYCMFLCKRYDIYTKVT